MQSPLSELASALDRLTARLDDLESRVSGLEHSRQAIAETDSQPRTLITEAHPLFSVFLLGSAGLMPAIGKLFLGLGGAFVLRSIAESSSVPRWTILPVALAYSGLWLFLSVRMYARSHGAGVAYAWTTAMITAPMVWELSLRFKILSPESSAAILVAFTLVTLAMCWKENLSAVAAPIVFSLCVTALLLMVGTRAPQVFVLALLFMAAVMELASGHRMPAVRATVALIIDAGFLILIVLYSGPYGPPLDYRSISPAGLISFMGALFAIYSSGLLIRTFFLRHEISVFDIFQNTIAATIAFIGALRLMDAEHLKMLGLLCILVAAGFYASALARMPQANQAVRYRVFTCWGAAVLIAGAGVAFFATGPWLPVVILGMAAVASAYSGFQRSETLMIFQGFVLLAAAMLAAGPASGPGSALVGDLDRAVTGPGVAASIFVLLCFAVTWRERDESTLGNIQRFVYSGLAAYVLAGVLVILTARFAGHGGLAVMRTFSLCAISVASAWSGARFLKPELTWLAYTGMAACTLKLLLLDLRGSATSIAVSLFLYGAVWMLIPRLIRGRERLRAAAGSNAGSSAGPSAGPN